MDTLKILSERREAVHQNLLRNERVKTEGRDKTSRDVAHSCGALLTITLDNPQENW